MKNYNTSQSRYFDDVERRILIVDDEPYNILGLKVQISQMGFSGIKGIIDQAFNGEEALSMVKKGCSNKGNQ